MGDHNQLGGYQLHIRLAHGAMGEVWEAECTLARAGLKPGDRVAVKLVPEFLLHDGMLVERIKREAEAIGRLKHPSIVKFHELGEDDGRVFMVLELLRGETLAQRLEREKQLPIAEIERIGGAIANALAYIHAKGIYHRDLKPQNIFITEQGAVKLIDLGVAKVLDEASLTMTGSHFGTPAYMSPESFRDSKKVTGAADVWSLGVILYEMATGQLPFPGSSAATIIAKISDTNVTPQSPARLRPELSDRIAQVIGKCLERAAPGRPAAGACAGLLGQLGADEPQSEAGLRRGLRFRPAMGLGLALVVGLLGWYIVRPQRIASAEPKHYAVLRITGAMRATDYSAAAEQLYNSQNRDGVCALAVGTGDVLVIQTGKCDVALRYAAEMGGEITVRADSYSSFVNGKLATIDLRDAATCAWVVACDPAQLDSLQSIIINRPTAASVSALAPAVAKIEARRPEVGVIMHNESDQGDVAPSPLSLLRPAWIMAKSASVARLRALFNIREVEALFLDKVTAADLRLLAECQKLRTLICSWPGDDEEVIRLIPESLRQIECLGLIDDTRYLPAIKQLGNLRELLLPAEVPALARPQLPAGLERVFIMSNDTAALTTAVARLPNSIRWISLYGKIPQEVLATLCGRRPGLEVLQLVKAEGITSYDPLLNLDNPLAVNIDAANWADADKRALLKLPNYPRLKLLGLGSEAYNDTATPWLAAVQSSNPQCTVVPVSGACLGSGWFLAMFLLLAAWRARARRAKRAANDCA